MMISRKRLLRAEAAAEVRAGTRHFDAKLSDFHDTTSTFLASRPLGFSQKWQIGMCFFCPLV